MKPLHERDLENLLTPDHTPEPPADLAARLKAEIPEILPTPANQPEPAAPSQRRWLIAAMLVTALGGGFLARQLLLDPPATESLHQQAPAATRTPPPALPENGATPSTEPESRREPPATAPLAKHDRVEEDLRTGDTSTTDARSTTERGAPSSGGAATDRLVGQVTSGQAVALPGAAAAAREQQKRKKQQRVLTHPASRSGSDDVAEGTGERPAEASDAEEADPLQAEADAIADLLFEPPLEETITIRVESPVLAERENDPRATPPPKRLRSAEEQNRAVRQQAPAPPWEIPKPSQAASAADRQLAAIKSEPPKRPDPPATPPYDGVILRDYGTNPFVDTEDDRLSTFAVDVDTGSYGIVRRYLRDGNLPPAAAVRVEELVNAFDYRDPAPEDGSDFALHAHGGPAPFAAYDGYRLLRFNLRGREIAETERRPADLIFVVDVSGSMARENRLGLVKRALHMLIDQLRPDDRLALVTYGDRGHVQLAPTTDHAAIRLAVAQLTASGSTNAEEGLLLAYGLATTHQRPGAMRRILLLSDGVANVGATGPQAILDRVRDQARQGVELTTVGVGMGNYNDVMMEQLANQGNGRYTYVDDLTAAHRIFVEQLSGTLQTIAADAKVQVDFDPEVVSRYRLLGYENRDVADRDFRNDKVDAGEIGAGHSVTALYEIKLHPDHRKRLRRRDVVATLTMRWGSVARGEVLEATRTVTGADFARSWEEASPALQLTAVIAEWSELLKGTVYSRPGEASTVDPFVDLLARAQRVQAHFPGDPEIAQLVGLIGQTIRLRRVQGNGVP